jgi:hypothetical protein
MKVGAQKARNRGGFGRLRNLSNGDLSKKNEICPKLGQFFLARMRSKLPRTLIELLEQEQAISEPLAPVEIPANSLAYLQQIYKDPSLSAHMRMRAAMACLPFEAPKLSVQLSVGETNYADRLEERVNYERKFFGLPTFKRPLRSI